MEQLNTAECNHSDEDRVVKRRLLYKRRLHALLEKCYVILDTYEISEIVMTEGLFKP